MLDQLKESRNKLNLENEEDISVEDYDVKNLHDLV